MTALWLSLQRGRLGSASSSKGWIGGGGPTVPLGGDVHHRVKGMVVQYLSSAKHALACVQLLQVRLILVGISDAQ